MKSFKPVYKYVAVVMMLLMFILGFSTTSDASSGREDLVTWGGGRSYRVFVPSGYTPGEPMPLVVMLHGCTQTSAVFRDGTQMNQLAEQENFIVLYPEQSTSANMNRCWNWFEPAHQRRGSGEPQIIVDMVRRVQSDFTIDHNAVFVAGLSAGGGMTVNLGVLYPDVFTAIAPFAGLAFQSGTSMMNAFQAMNPGTPATNPTTAANNALNQVPAHARRVVPALIMQGSTDNTVRPAAAEHIVTQMLAYNRHSDPTLSTTATTRSGSEGGLSFTDRAFANGEGFEVVRHHLITGLGHTWSGGNGSIAHTDSRGTNASYLSWRFFQAAAGIGGGVNGGANGGVNGGINGDNGGVNGGVNGGINGDNGGVNGGINGANGGGEQPIEYIFVSANVNQHNMAGRIPANLFFHYFSIHGPTGAFNMYQIVGTNTWTSTRPGS